VNEDAGLCRQILLGVNVGDGDLGGGAVVVPKNRIMYPFEGLVISLVLVGRGRRWAICVAVGMGR
jgi:hypothetical protein